MSSSLCRWCVVPIRTADVIVGRPGQTKTVKLKIDTAPHPDGSVIVRSDGAFRMLGPRQKRDPNRQFFRVHGAKACGPNSWRSEVEVFRRSEKGRR